MTKPIVEDLEPFREGGPFYKYEDTRGKKCGYRDKNGNVVINPKFEDAHKFSDDLARVQVDGRWGYIDRGGHFVIEPVWMRAFDFNEGKAEVRNSKGEAYLIDKAGNIIKRLNPNYV
jgi:hypothetical protein